MFFKAAKFVRKDLEFLLQEKVLKKNLIIFCAEIVVRGNAVQICSDFPAKRLSIFLKHFSWHLSDESNSKLK